MHGIGTDIVEINRIKKALERYPHRFPSRILSEEEMALAPGNQRFAQYLAGRFAAKEALLKAFGTGLRNCLWTDISILNNKLGKPEVNLKGNLLELANDIGIKQIQLSISHTSEYAVAFCIIE